MLVTVKSLKRLGACQDQLEKFEATFGQSVEVTEALCVEHAQTFSWGWAARNLLPASAVADYDRAMASALADYKRATAPALADYERATASAWADYKRATASAFGKLAENI